MWVASTVKHVAVQVLLAHKPIVTLGGRGIIGRGSSGGIVGMNCLRAPLVFALVSPFDRKWAVSLAWYGVCLGPLLRGQVLQRGCLFVSLQVHHPTGEGLATDDALDECASILLLRLRLRRLEGGSGLRLC